MAAVPLRMNCMTALVFVDAKVFIYAKQAGEPVKQPLAARWLERLW